MATYFEKRDFVIFPDPDNSEHSIDFRVILESAPLFATSHLRELSMVPLQLMMNEHPELFERLDVAAIFWTIDEEQDLVVVTTVLTKGEQGWQFFAGFNPEDSSLRAVGYNENDEYVSLENLEALYSKALEVFPG